MSLDTLKPRATEMRPTHATVRQLLARAKKDTDPVSMFPDGICWEDTDTCIFVVKGREHIDYLRGLLRRQGLLTEGKAVACDNLG